MNKPINPKIHGVMDYLYGIFLLVAPGLFGFAGTPATVLYVLGGAHLLLSVMTAYPMGLIKRIPFTVHSKIEITTALFTLVAPWLLGFAEFDFIRNLYLAAGGGLVLAWLMTDYRDYRSGRITEIYPEEVEQRRAA